jgi:hypothetical protein
MPSDVGQGTTLSFGTSMAKVVDINFSANGNPVDLSVLADTAHKYGAGLPDLEVQATHVGTGGGTLNSTGALVIVWNDGTTDTLGTYLMTSKTKQTGVGGRIESRCTYKPSA